MFSTRPLYRCQTDSIESPLLEPAEISGSFITYQKDAKIQRDGKGVISSSFEFMRGIQKDEARLQVVISVNVSSLGGIGAIGAYINTVNDATLWGFPTRCVKLSGISFTRKLYGTCTFYYTLQYTFDCDYNGWDFTAVDEGTRVLGYSGTSTNPTHFVKWVDKEGNPGRVVLDGAGNAWTGGGVPGTRTFEFYNESDMLSLEGVPATIGD